MEVGRSNLITIVAVLAVLAMAVPVSAVGIGGATAASNPSIGIRCMTWNLFYGGDSLNNSHGNSNGTTWVHSPDGCVANLNQVVATIRASQADIVGLQEAVGNTQWIAQQLGWYWSNRTQIISRYPIIDPPGGNGWGNGGYVFVEPFRGFIAAVADVHLNATPYGPYLVQQGATLDEVLSVENSVVMPGILQDLRVLPTLASQRIPVFLTGDFNSPSYLDWTAQVAAVRADVRYPVDWPVSQALANAGFTDSYRSIYPDPVANPGFTWTPYSPEEINPSKNEVMDRIDWVLSAGPAKAVNSQLMGEAGNPDVNIVENPWPSDHRAVVSSFQVTLGAMPTLVAVDKRGLTQGDTLNVRFHSASQNPTAVAIVPAGGAPSSTLLSKVTAGANDGTVAFATGGLAPRAYEAILVGKSCAVLSRIPFWLYAPGSIATVSTSKSLYKVGEPIIVSWTDAPGMRWDWVAIYSHGQGSGNPVVTDTNYSNAARGGPNSHYLVYDYTRATVEGSIALSASSYPGYVSWPIGPGNYQIRLLFDDGYRTIASSATFTVTK